MALSEKQRRFCEEYIVDLNATQAAIRAGYSEKTANEQGSRLLVNVSIQEAISGLRKKQQKRTQVTADRVVRELARVAFFDIRKVASWGGDAVRFTPSDAIDANSARAIQSIKSKSRTVSTEDGEYTTVELELKMADKLSALDKLAKHVGLYADNGDDEPEPPPLPEPAEYHGKDMSKRRED